MKTFLIYTGLALISFITNALIYNISFNQQATPLLSEEQRLDSALLMLSTTLPAYFFSAVVMSLMFYWVARRFRK